MVHAQKTILEINKQDINKNNNAKNNIILDKEENSTTPATFSQCKKIDKNLYEAILNLL